jgi:hypothetical protein
MCDELVMRFESWIALMMNSGRWGCSGISPWCVCVWSVCVGRFWSCVVVPLVFLFSSFFVPFVTIHKFVNCEAVLIRYCIG